MRTRVLHYLTKPALDHLHGRHPWPATLIISVIAATHVYKYGLQQLPTAPAYPAIACWIILGSTLLIWQITGTLRAIRHALAPPSDTTAIAGGYVTILIAIILMALTMIDGAVRHLPKPEPTALRSGPTFEVTFDVATATASLDGEINYASKAALDDVLDHHPTVRRLVLNSSGGRIFAARAIAKRVLDRQLDTHVSARCYSACTIVFIAGTQRTLAPTGELGFHRYGFENRFAVQTVSPSSEQAQDLIYFRQRSISTEFLDRIFNADHNSIWKPDHATLRAANVITMQTHLSPKAPPPRSP